MAVKSDMLAAIEQIAHERKISADAVVDSLKSALEAAYKKEYLENKEAEVRVEIVPSTGEIKMYLVKLIVEDAEFNDKDLQVALSDAQKIAASLKIGDKVENEVILDQGFGRIAAQVAKQVILQKIREEEKKSVIEEFKDKEGTIVSGVVQRVVRGDVIVELGKATGVMPADEKIFQEYYKTGETYKFLLKKVASTTDESTGFSAQLVLSRSDADFLIGLFALEVPEIMSGTVEAKAIAREAGSRSKLAVASNQQGVDPIGSCVGQKGMRIMNIQNELSDQNYEEKIDIIEWDEDPAQFVANALSPAKVIDVKLNEKEETATVIVDDDQLSLAIGKEGQNVRLAHKLTNWKIEINPDTASKGKKEGEASGETEDIADKKKKITKKEIAELETETPIDHQSALPDAGEVAESGILNEEPDEEKEPKQDISDAVKEAFAKKPKKQSTSKSKAKQTVSMKSGKKATKAKKKATANTRQASASKPVKSKKAKA